MLKGGKICILLNLIDLLFTEIGIKTDLFEEGHFILRWYYDAVGITGIAAVKILIFGSLVAGIEFAWRKKQITKSKGEKYYAVANLIFILFLFFFAGLINIPRFSGLKF